jgi:hypothetical protein
LPRQVTHSLGVRGTEGYIDSRRIESSCPRVSMPDGKGGRYSTENKCCRRNYRP